ncbi:MAG: tetratricopeptide repeat protein [Bdellovibrionales bacterium]|jgi:TPR repeat protein|nr:tetratricopeptide repeat protein [Bdellovibrionales bacterium]
MRFKVLMLVLAFMVALPMAAAHANFTEGKKSYDNKNWRRAILHLRPLVEQGDARAMVLMGNMYAEGHGVEKDTNEAFVLYRGAAERNNPDGMLATATLYQVGEGVPANTRLAIMWFERGAQLGHQSSAFFYAMHLYQGSKGVTFDFKPDHVAAYKWFRIAAQRRGDPKVARAADAIAEKLRSELHYNDIEAMDRAVTEWQPADPHKLGPVPEAVVAEEKESQPEAAPQEQKPAEAKTE